MEKPFYIRQLPKEAQDWLKDKAYKSFIADGDKEDVAQKKAEDFLDEKVDVAEEFYGKDFLKEVGKKEPKYEVVNDKALDAIKDNFTPPGAKKKMARKIRAKDRPEWIWDDEDVFKRFAGTPFVQMADDKDRKETYNYYRNKPIDDLMKDKDISEWYEFVGDDEEVEPNNWSTKELYKGGNPYEDVEDMLDEWDKEDVKDTIDTNDNGEIEEDEMADFQKSLDDYAAKNKKSREDIPATYKR